MIKTVTITILSVLLFFTSLSARDHIDVEFWLESGRDLLVVVDGHEIGRTGDKVLVRNLSTGHHAIKLYEVRRDRSFYYSNRKKFLYAGSIFVKPDRSYGFVLDQYRRLHKVFEKQNAHVNHHVCSQSCSNPCSLGSGWVGPHVCDGRCSNPCAYAPRPQNSHRHCEQYCGQGCTVPRNSHYQHNHVCNTYCASNCPYSMGSYGYGNYQSNPHNYNGYPYNNGWRENDGHGYSSDDRGSYYGSNGFNGYQDVGRNRAMSNEVFHDLKYRLSSETMEKDKRLLLDYFSKNHYFSSAQVEAILAEFYFESSKLEVAKLLYPVTIDQENYYRVSDGFAFSSSKNRLKEWIDEN